MPITLNVHTATGAFAVPLVGTLSIGRAAGNDILLEDIDVSRKHATLSERDGGGLFVDLGSANGSQVNGREIEPRVPFGVGAGDRIALGNCVIELTAGAPGGRPQAGAAVDPAYAPTLPGSRPPPAPVISTPAGPRGTVIAARAPRIQIVTRQGTREIRLERDEVTLGRDPSNAIVVESDVVSRHHLVFKRTGGTYLVQDLGTTNGIRVRGEPVASHLLQHGDVFDIGGEVAFRFSLAPEEAAETAPPPQVLLDPRKTIRIGRAADCELRLTHPTISLYHARLSSDGKGGRVVEDLGSTNGTFVNGVPLVRGHLVPIAAGDLLQVGPVRLSLGESGVVSEDQSRNLGLTAVHLNQRVNANLNLLQDISVVIEPQEFVAVVGVSGSGKSTLLGALSGLRPASDGDVLLNGVSLYSHFQAFRTSLGYVPQDDILHAELPVGRALGYAAELRLPDDTPKAERARRVKDVITTLGLGERVETRVGRLSGGQRKRVSIGAELLTQPGVFYLDEATSGLDPGTESQLMRLLRRLADEGHTILLITHATKNVMMCDQVLFLARGGNLAYFGPPDQALTYFGVEDFDGIYEKLEGSDPPEVWASRYRASPQYQEFVARRLAAEQLTSGAGGPAGTARTAKAPKGRTSSAFRQLKVLSVRYADIIRRDRVNLALLFLLAPVLSLVDLVAWPGNVLSRTAVGGDGATAMTMLFLSALIPFLVGSLSFVREIVKEAAIYARERAVALKTWPYLGSKVLVGGLFALYHAACLFAMKVLAIDFPGVDTAHFAAMYITIVLAVVSGVMWALLISSLTSKEEQAMMLIIGLIVLQVVFSGGLVPLSDLGPVGTVLSSASSTAWAFKALTTTSGLSTAGCSGDFAHCNMPGIQLLQTPAERQLAFSGVNKQFGDIFGSEIIVCWLAMIAIIIGLALILFFLQKRKDVL